MAKSGENGLGTTAPWAYGRAGVATVTYGSRVPFLECLGATGSPMRGEARCADGSTSTGLHLLE